VGDRPEEHGDQLIRITLKPEAWIVRLTTATGRRSRTSKVQELVPISTVLASPQRIAAIYFVADRSVTSAPGVPAPISSFREYALCNESMIAVLVILRRHEETIAALSWDEYRDLAHLGWRSSHALRVFKPRRIYVAALGSATPRTTSFPHVHLHVIPLVDGGEADRPAAVWMRARHVRLREPRRRDFALRATARGDPRSCRVISRERALHSRHASPGCPRFTVVRQFGCRRARGRCHRVAGRGRSATLDRGRRAVRGR